MWPRLAALAVLVGLPGASSFEAALPADDECLVGADCGLNALQRRGALEERPEEAAPSLADAGADSRRRSAHASSARRRRWSGWSQGGDKMWGRGVGMESINATNVGYYDKGMYATLKRCGGAGCALITNPMHHRSVEHFHIHFTHYAGYGASLKSRVEKMVCGKSGWHRGHLPCHGQAAFFSGFPAVFSEAMKQGDLSHASVVAWPGACGGSGTIIELAYHCSIEHQIRGDFNRKYRKYWR